MAKPSKRPWTVMSMSAPYRFELPHGKWTDVSRQMEEQIQARPKRNFANCNNDFKETFVAGFDILKSTISKNPKETPDGVVLSNIIFMNIDTGIIVYANPKSLYIDDRGPIVGYTLTRSEPDKKGHVCQTPIDSLEDINYRLFNAQLQTPKM